MRSALFIAAALAVLVPEARAQDKPAVIVTDPSGKTYKAAVQRFADRQAAPDPARVEALRGGIENGLAFSQVFAAIDAQAFLGPRETSALDGVPPPACPDWSQIGADALVEGQLVTGPQGMTVEYRVWDVVRCRSLKRKRYFGGPADVAMIARRIADDVVEAFTGRPGISSTEIAFISDRTGRKEVYIMNADGSDVRAATRNRSINAFPSWVPGGNEIVYTSYRYKGQPTVFLLSRGKKQPGRLLERIADGAPIYRGVFDPKGDQLAYVMSVNGAPDIFVGRPDGRSSRRLTDHRAIDISPSWSPDGKRMAFVSDRSGSPQVYIMDANGGNLRRLTYQGNYNTSPAWSPDGQWIAYESRVGGQFDLWLIDPEGRTNVPLISHPQSDESPSWAPDGRTLAFASSRRGRFDIYVVGIDGQNPRRLTADGGSNTSPAWGPHPGAR